MKGRIPWTLFTAITVVITLVFAVSRGQERELEPRRLPKPPWIEKPSLAPQQKDAMDEILRIRQRHGDLLAGSIFAELAEESEASVDPDRESNRFADALKRVIQSAAPASNSLTRQCEADYARATSEEIVGKPAEDAFSRSLRRSARLLDRRANDLENRLLYAEADRLRDLASQLRAEARSSNPDTPTHSRQAAKTAPRK